MASRQYKGVPALHQARITQAITQIEDHIAVLSAQGIPLPVLGLELAASELRRIGGAQ